MRARRTPLLLVPALAATALLALPAGPGAAVATAVEEAAQPTVAARVGPPKVAVQTGTGGAVASVDPDATAIGLDVLEAGGNAVDAAVATAAALGVTEPLSAGIGGGGYFMYLDGRTGEVLTIDGRETAPRTSPRNLFIDPATGDPYEFYPDLVTSGLVVGTPGTVATWEEALDRWGTRSLGTLLRPAADLAKNGFVVDQTLADQIDQNRDRFAQIRSTAELFLHNGAAPRVGSTFRNPGLAQTYAQLANKGTRVFYRGSLARNIASTVQRPPTLEGELPVPPGFLTVKDLERYEVLVRRPITLDYRGVTVHGMGSSSSGGSTVGQALRILEQLPLASYTDERIEHVVLEASALAFADRARYVGDRQFVDVPDSAFLDEEYARERLCLLSTTQAAPKPVEPGLANAYDGRCDAPAERTRGVEAEDHENGETTHLVVSDRLGNVVSYTLTLEQTGGSGVVVPGRGFLLNNELTDFSLIWARTDPNRLDPGKRPRSSMSPTIITDGRTPLLAFGSPGGSTIISTVLGLVVDTIDRGQPLDEALESPRAAQRNTTFVDAEPGWLDRYESDLDPFGHLMQRIDLPQGEIGAATGLEFRDGSLITAVAERVRRGGGDARVVNPR